MIPSADAIAPLSVHFEQFDGPLDLLLHEVRRQNVEIQKVSMAPITARFLEYLRTASRRNVNLNIEWLHMAATLIHWKSQALLPAERGAGSPVDSIPDELVRQLLAHRQQIAQELERRQSGEAASFSRGTNRSVAESPNSEELPGTTVWDMIQQAKEMADWVQQHRQNRRYTRGTLDVAVEEVSVSDMTGYLETQLSLASGRKLDGLRLLSEQTSLSRRSCLFLAMLEMARDKRINLEQSENFAPLLLTSVDD